MMNESIPRETAAAQGLGGAQRVFVGRTAKNEVEKAILKLR
jgi:hypothetical protein